MAIKRALVVGGGIGGLCTAVGLGRAGIEVDIVEKNAKWTVYGVGIIQPSNQLRALEELGLADACVARGAPFDGWEFYDQGGKFHARMPNPRAASARYPPINGMGRRELHDILIAEVERLGVDVRLATTVERFDHQPDYVTVHLSDGSATNYDVVIAADGTYSQIRSLLFEDSAAPVYNGLAVWRYNFPRPPEMTWGAVHYGKRAKVGLVPMAKSLMYIFVVTAEPGNPRIPKADLARVMRERLVDFVGPVAALRDQITDPEGVVYRPMEPVLLASPWHRGRVLLIGDAAHSTTPQLSQGASMAVEDAALLSQLLPQHRPLSDIFDEFMRRRYERCKLVVETSQQLGRWELAEFEGRPDPSADAVGVMTRSSQSLAQPY